MTANIMKETTSKPYLEMTEVDPTKKKEVKSDMDSKVTAVFDPPSMSLRRWKQEDE